MPLPGKLTIGFLEEDNPVKAYFRIRPVCVLEDGRYSLLEEVGEKYPEDGFIRIVPDKNEIATFKNRMRSLGRYCALDLRKYPGENEKIRPNKNFGMANERNASIVYSDVITQTPCEAAVQILDAQYVFPGEEMTLRTQAPGTDYVLIRREGQITGPWKWSADKDVAGCIALHHADGLSFKTVREDEIREKVATLTNAEGSFMLMTDPALFGITDTVIQNLHVGPDCIPAETEPRQADAVEEAPASGEPSEAEKMPTAQEPSPSSARPGREAARISGEREVVRETSTYEEHGQMHEMRPRQSDASRKTDEARAAAVTPQEDVPLADKADAVKKLRAVAGRLSLHEQTLQAQSGINPRRGRSLSEVVDEQWRKSRYEQLGHPVPPEATGRPVLSPIDRAAQAVSEAWAIEDARGGLLQALLKDEEIRSAFMEALHIHAQSTEVSDSERMEEMEAEKLKLISEIDALRIRRSDMKKELMEELREAHQRDFDALNERSRKIQEEIKRNETAAGAAQKAAEAAQNLLSQSSDKLLQKMMEQAAAVRSVRDVLDGIRQVPCTHPRLYRPTAGELISDIRVQMDAAGFPMQNDQAVSLMMNLTAGSLMVVSGPAGSGKSRLVRSFAGALGLTRENGCFLKTDTVRDRKVDEFIERLDGLTPAILLIDDANMPDAPGVMEDALRLSDRIRESGMPLMIVLTAQDAPEGMPLSARLLSRSFFLRLEAPASDQAWKPVPGMSSPAGHAVSAESLREIFAGAKDMPCGIEARLERLRKALQEIGYRLDRRTLGEMWTYCAGMSLTGRMSDMDVLDLAVCQRALPAMLAGMETDQLVRLPEILCDMPKCMALMEVPLPLPPL